MIKLFYYPKFIKLITIKNPIIPFSLERNINKDDNLTKSNTASLIELLDDFLVGKPVGLYYILLEIEKSKEGIAEEEKKAWVHLVVRH